MSKLTVPLKEETIIELKSNFPIDPSFERISLPRLAFKSQDMTEGKGKQMKVVQEAGTFITERQSKEINEETGKPVWEKTEIGKEVEGVIVYQRKQLSYYDDSSETYTSSPIYDTDDQIIPLWCNGAEIDSGTSKELKARSEYATTTLKGKPSSKLKDNRILYVLVDDELFQLNLHGS